MKENDNLIGLLDDGDLKPEDKNELVNYLLDKRESEKPKEITEEEFVKKIMEGKRDFSNMTIIGNYYLSDVKRLVEFNKYLVKQNLKENPLILNDSRITGHFAPSGARLSALERRLYLPYTQAKNLQIDDSWVRIKNFDFSNSDFSNCKIGYGYLEEGIFNNSNLDGLYIMRGGSNIDFRNTRLKRSYLGGSFAHCSFKNANLENSYLGEFRDCHFDYADFKNVYGRAIFDRSSLKKVKNLNQTPELSRIRCEQVEIDDKNKEILMKIIERNSFKPHKNRKSPS